MCRLTNSGVAGTRGGPEHVQRDQLGGHTAPSAGESRPNRSVLSTPKIKSSCRLPSKKISAVWTAVQFLQAWFPG